MIPEDRITLNTIQEHILDIINQEIANCPIDNLHGIDAVNIKSHLVDPTLESYLEPLDPTTRHSYWTVLLEDPINNSCYTIYCNPQEFNFGLGMHDESDNLIALGNYGSFIDAVNGM